MKASSLFSFTIVAYLALSVLGIAGAPPFRKTSQPVAADWWVSYLDTHAYKQPPSISIVQRARGEHLAQHFEPFQQRLARLEQLKRWVLGNAETKRVLTPSQRGTLSKPFLAWDQEALRGDVKSRAELARRVEQESGLVENVEDVLNDVAMFLPDVKYRW
ncbi:hypothetical protein PSEUBRA_006380 [Kalmanozyma brasiliensis GHG001]|uniref:uncharacterized protein n=1 Tax=Kalmanozyma brasiliensis (strain GHG001) TaxID=1365824 RepID=UPI0028681D7E|nr:uncharacterized protein PSEUBRA_006380 [Kalmanozyma brasiliensis GHG001]KAF6767673.1 hypothetical protein PSEUBRA_006380 [Kalmanozyma brasiliensis GHG001]